MTKGAGVAPRVVRLRGAKAKRGNLSGTLLPASLSETEEKSHGEEPDRDLDQPAARGDHPRETDTETGAAEPRLEHEEAAHMPVVYFLRKACNAARKSGVVRLTALTSAPNRSPSSNRRPSSW